ncbi:class I SAM-dependent methyltransferase [Telmatospirillum sp. J64-1]|uniref:class I SAM-dependent methyltransferase n=1 Tax=Telmatospirillum sp. J64-1 TaxID=2502183 RepID=UPI00115D4247|nr:class I SAM-dependent methyltransferase [Telmatospirillum sp. J64-1]
MPQDKSQEQGSFSSFAAVKAAYGRNAGIYDLVFGAALDRGRRAALQAMDCGLSRRVLEIGVGTGLSLPSYSPQARVVGIDVSPEMLVKARERAERLNLRQVEVLAVMDGQRLAFRDGSFEAVVAMYVLSVTPEPRRLLREMRRVCAPGGEVFIINRFSSAKKLGRLVERIASPLSSAIGFRTTLSPEVLDELDGMTLAERRDIPGFTGTKMLRYVKPG